MVGQPAAFRRVAVSPELQSPQPNAATIWRPISETDALSAQLVLYRQTVEAALFGIEFDPDSAAVENLRGRRGGAKQNRNYQYSKFMHIVETFGKPFFKLIFYHHATSPFNLL